MIRDTPRLRALDRRYEREAYGGMSYADALDRFAALWAVAREVGVAGGGEDWKRDLEPDLAIARVLNGR